MNENENGQVQNQGNNLPAVRTDSFGMVATMTMNEVSAMAVAEQAKAAVQARYAMAARFPRNQDEVRANILKECKRRTFAETAIYRKPVGEGRVEGFSIRFAETALRCLKNVLPETYIVYDDEEKRILRVMLTDLEANLTYCKDVIVRKEVERSSVKEGQQVLGKRVNSRGKLVYLVRATEDDMLMKANSLESKALRNHVTRIMPGDLLEECKAAMAITMQAEDAKDPDAARKKLADAFFLLGIKPTDLVRYLGHDLDRITPGEVANLRAVHAAIRDGEATWDDFMEPAAKEHEEKAAAAPTRTDALKDKVKDKVAGKRKAASPPEAAPAKEPSAPPAPPSEAPAKAAAGADDSVVMVEKAYGEATKVLNAWQLNRLLLAAGLPISPYDSWSHDQRVYGTYLLNEVVDRVGAPQGPDAPFWLGTEEAEVWMANYKAELAKAGLAHDGALI